MSIEDLPSIKGYIAKSKYGEIGFFSVMPEREEEFGEWVVYGACIQMSLGWKFNDTEFKNLRWEDEPVPYELILKKI